LEKWFTDVTHTSSACYVAGRRIFTDWNECKYKPLIIEI